MLDRQRIWALHALNPGTLVGIGIAVWVSKGHLAFFPEQSDRAQLIIYGGLVGSAAYKALRSGLLSFLKFLCDYVQLLEAYVFRKARLIDDRQFIALLRHLVGRHFGLSHDCGLKTELREKEVAPPILFNDPHLGQGSLASNDNSSGSSMGAPRLQ